MSKPFISHYWMHSLSWLAFALMLFVAIPMFYPGPLPMVYHLYNVVLLLALIGIYYLNTCFLIPRVSSKGISVYYLLAFIAVGALFISLMRMTEDSLDVKVKVYQSLYPDREYDAQEHKSYVNYYLLFLTAIVFGVGYTNQIVKKWRLEKEKSRKIKAEKVKAELDSLKAQINPHFFFNTLNTIYALTFRDIEKSQKAILKLSKMMRYAMNEDKKELVPLKEETAFIRSYLALMQYRLGDNVALSFALTGENEESEIAPMLLLSFIENCFKHGLSASKKCIIDIRTSFEGSYFVLKTENDYFPMRKSSSDKGIGIENTLRRLDILYGKDYTLNQEVLGDRYHTCLKIKLL